MFANKHNYAYTSYFTLMSKKAESVHTLLAGKSLLQERVNLQTQKLLITANNPIEKASRLYEVIVKISAIPAAVVQAFCTAIDQEDQEELCFLTKEILALMKQQTSMPHETKEAPYAIYEQAFQALASSFQNKANSLNANYKLLTLYHLSTELIISCPTCKNILLVQLMAHTDTHLAYKLKFTFNDIEKATFSFDKQKREKDVWLELSYSTGISYFTTQDIVQYWIPKLFRHTR